ncbi:MAG TPA: metal-dependent transcriptional regulator [Geobacterales bacterium]|nr:metal-dependent transcriptional regulator [Geobacterales bacterium]
MKRGLAYLMLFYESKKPLRLKDVSRKLNVKMPSALETISRLMIKGYLQKVSRGCFEISDEGKKYVEEMMWRHAVLEWTFMNKLNIQSKDLCKTVSKIEELIPLDIIEELCEMNKHPITCPHNIEAPHPGKSRKATAYKYCEI